MSLLAIVILIAVILAVLMGAVKLAFWAMVTAIAYLCVCAVIEWIESWLKP